jgi:hypothetical protein
MAAIELGKPLSRCLVRLNFHEGQSEKRLPQSRSTKYGPSRYICKQTQVAAEEIDSDSLLPILNAMSQCPNQTPNAFKQPCPLYPAASLTAPSLAGGSSINCGTSSTINEGVPSAKPASSSTSSPNASNSASNSASSTSSGRS